VKLEVLGDGQQFVAFHVHPDTGKPYRWKDKKHPANTALADLPVIDQEDAREIVAEFERLARDKGWPEKNTVKRLAAGGSGKYDLDDPFVEDKSKVEITAEELRAKLQSVPNCDDYDTWFHVGMALHHQFDGTDEGLLLWHEWSSQAHNYDQDVLDEKWSTFSIQGKKREPLTARFILKQAQQEEERLATEELDEVREEIKDASDLPQIKAVCSRIKNLAFDSLVRESLVTDIKDKIKKVSGTNMSPAAVRALIRYENPEHRAMPTWLEQFVYCQHDETFYSTKTRQMLTTRAFDQSFARYMMTKKDRLEGRSAPEHTASHVALNRYQIPVVANRMYLPGEEDIFTLNGLDFVNSYTDIGIPITPNELNRKGRGAVDAVLKHMEHLFVDDRERKLLLSWIAYIVQSGKRSNWAPVIQGVQGDGKTFFHLLLGAVLGAENVKTIPGEALTEKNTAWAEGTQFCLVEEVRLHGKDRYEVINKVKPYITNQMVSIRRMRTDWYDVINTVNYLLTTNHKDGVPVDANDTRYYPMFSRWQVKATLDIFNENNPNYYVELMAALEEPGALRRWLLDYELHKDFDPWKRAPVSHAKAEMIFLNQTEEEEAFSAALDGNKDRAFCSTLLDSSLVHDKMTEQGATAPYGRALKMMLSEHGFAFVGQAKDLEGKNRKWWSQEPQRFRRIIDKEAKPNGDAIRAWLKGESEDTDDI
jgi:hypothetical protein